MSRTATVTVRLSLPMLHALDAVMDGYTLNECHEPHPHPGYGCDGWPPRDVRSLDAAYRRLWRARRRAEREYRRAHP
jgi:hypothetical protein